MKMRTNLSSLRNAYITLLEQKLITKIFMKFQSVMKSLKKLQEEQKYQKKKS